MNIVVPGSQTTGPYPAATNHLINDPTPKDQAVYIPSVSPGYAMKAYAKNWDRALPKGVTPEDMNFLDPNNKIFRISHVMSSAGQALNQSAPCIITERDRSATIMIGDSGGYQIANGRLKINGTADIQRILSWLEYHADIAMTLDVPTGSLLTNPDYPYGTYRDCLNATLVYLEYFQKHRKGSNTKFLNVLQGNTTQETDVWYKAVKNYDFEGWAFAGKMRHNFFNLCRRLIQMVNENKLQSKHWIHVLGTNEIETAIGLTAIQRALTKHVSDKIRISYDTSTPFRILGWSQAVTFPNFDKHSMTISTELIPDDPSFYQSNIRWPWPSAFGDRLTMGDICARNSLPPSKTLDNQSSQYVAFHNLTAICSAIALANRIFDTESINHQHTIGERIGAAVEAIEEIFRTGTQASLLKYRTTFERLKNGKEPTSGDEERDF